MYLRFIDTENDVTFVTSLPLIDEGLSFNFLFGDFGVDGLDETGVERGIAYILTSLSGDEISFAYQDEGEDDYDIRYILIEPAAMQNPAGRLAALRADDLKNMTYNEVAALYNIPD